MLRLAHRILSQTPLTMEPVVRAHAHDMAGLRQRVQNERELLRRAPVFIIDNVAEFYGRSEQQDWGPKDFPNCAPPFPMFFMEWNVTDLRLPDRLVPAVEQSSLQDGFLFWSTSPAVWLNTIQVGQWVKCQDTIGRIVTVLEGHPDAWVLSGSFWMANRNNGVPGWVGALITALVDHSGELVEQWALGYMDPDTLKDVQSQLRIPLLALSFLHCKNVVVHDATESAGPPAKWLRRQRQPTLRYHVLDIDPMRKVLRTEGQSETTGLKRALHICRGHFARYTPEAPLFGKHVGTFWHPSHVRGTAEAGQVEKDYRVLTSPVKP